jgi:large subunit ribosomal protein L21
MYAVIQTGGKQYKVENDQILFVEKLNAEEKDTVTFDVVALGADDGIKVGTPLVKGAKVTAEVLKNGKGKKLRVSTYKPRKGSSKRTLGHRQPYTKVQIKSIEA